MLALSKIFNPFNRNSLLEDCMEGIVKKDRDSLVILYEETKEAIYGYALSILKNKHDAEDVFQEVYIKIYEKAETYNATGKPLAWIMTIARNLCYEKMRKHKDEGNIDEMHNLGIVDKGNKNVEDKIILDIAFSKITDEERNIIILHIVSGLKHREIAKLLELPLSTVLSKYNRAIKRMKDLLKEDMK